MSPFVCLQLNILNKQEYKPQTTECEGSSLKHYLVKRKLREREPTTTKPKEVYKLSVGKQKKNKKMLVWTAHA